jgi:hypothetical protein
MTRTALARLDFERLDPSDAVEGFLHRGDFKASRKTGAFAPIAPLTPAQIEQITPAPATERSWRDMTAVERQKVQYEALMYEYLKRVDDMPLGRWFEYDDLRRDVTRRCKLSARLAETQSFVFVNRVGVQVFDKPRKAFAYDLQMGHARIIEDAPLFDRTIERIAANLRKLAGET